jgi:hypothetical protein
MVDAVLRLGGLDGAQQLQLELGPRPGLGGLLGLGHGDILRLISHLAGGRRAGAPPAEP